MDEQFTVRSLKAQEVTDMYLTFLDAFSDYPVSFKLSKAHFVRKFVQKLNIDFHLSAGTYDYSGAMLGFIFTSIDSYNGKKTAYNGGTGVRPRHRGNRLTQNMYEFLIPKLKDEQVNQCVLEVLTQNEKAIKVYENIGFEKSQLFKCFKLPIERITIPKSPDLDLQIYNVNIPDFHTYDKYNSYHPSFLDSSKMLSYNLPNETIVEARYGGECVGYAIFQPSIGRISQIGVDPKKRQMGIGSSLIKYIFDTSVQKSLSILNVNHEAKETLKFFTKMGFENQLDQFEMTMNL